MKKVISILFILLLFGCSPSSSEKKLETVSNDTLILSNPIIYDTIDIIKNSKKLNPTIDSISNISHDTTILKSKKVVYTKQKHYIKIEKSDILTSKDGQTIIKPNLIKLTKEKRVLKVVPNIEKSTQNLKGRLNYLMADTMEVGVTNVVSVTISRNMSKNMVLVQKVFTSKINKNVASEIVDTIIRITPEMVVKLQEIGTVGNFHIDTITPSKQLIELNTSDLTLWQWRVTPLKDGNKELTITVDLYIDGVEKNLNIYDGKIYVHMKNKFWITIQNFFVDNWEWLWTVIFIPLFIWLFNTYILPKFKTKKIINKHVKKSKQ